MAKFKEKERAIILRRKGASYSQIRKILKVSKSTLSLWLKEYPLSEGRIRELRDWSAQRIEHYRETRRRTRDTLLKNIYEEERGKILPLSKRDLLIAGLFLYWGEGSKTKVSETRLTNTDPGMIRAFIRWATEILGVELDYLSARLYLYRDMNVKSEIQFWAQEIGLPISQFRTPSIKKTNRLGLSYKNGFNHGTCHIMLSNAIVSKKVHMGLKVLRDYFSKMRP